MSCFTELDLNLARGDINVEFVLKWCVLKLISQNLTEAEVKDVVDMCIEASFKHHKKTTLR